MKRQASTWRKTIGPVLLALVLTCNACIPTAPLGGSIPAPSAMPPAAAGPEQLTVVESAVAPSSTPSTHAPASAVRTAPPSHITLPSTRTGRIAVTSQVPRSTARVRTLTPPPPATPETRVPTPTSRSNPVVSSNAEPLIFTEMAQARKCGHADVVAMDGHWMRATPRIGVHERNKLELIQYGQRVDLIDCRLWTNTESDSWVAVRTANGKLGWMMLQSDKFYVTIYPIPLNKPAPLALTGIPSGATVAYVPPSDCSPTKPPTSAVATSIGIDFIPIVGDLKGLGEAATGCDLVTGESLGDWRWLGLLGLIGLSEVMLLRHGDDAARAAWKKDWGSSCYRPATEPGSPAHTQPPSIPET
jgi:hypothetical protein